MFTKKLRLKDGVLIQGMSNEVLLCVMIVQKIYESYGYDCIVTSALDGLHSKNSLHYSGNAIDFRIRHLKKKHKHKIFEDIKSSLTKDFDVVLESTHIHVEYQPKFLGRSEDT